MATPKEEIDRLRAQLEEYNRRYYLDNDPVVSDRQFDELMRRLQDLEKQYPQYDDPNSPTRRVGSDLTNRFESVRHRYPMMSLSNTYSLEELREFYDRVREEAPEADFVCELKFDGTAISLTYEHGRRRDGQRADHPQRAAGAHGRRLSG